MTAMAATLALTVASPLAAQTEEDLRPMDVVDSSAEMQADFDYNPWIQV